MIAVSQFGPWLPWAQLVVTVGTILFAVKSAYNGYIRRWAQALDMIPEIMGMVEDIEDHQEDQTDAIVALSVDRRSERVEVDHNALVDGLRDDTGSERFLRGSSSPYEYAKYTEFDDEDEDTAADGSGDSRWADTGEGGEDKKEPGKP